MTDSHRLSSDPHVCIIQCACVHVCIHVCARSHKVNKIIFKNVEIMRLFTVNDAIAHLCIGRGDAGRREKVFLSLVLLQREGSLTNFCQCPLSRLHSLFKSKNGCITHSTYYVLSSEKEKW